MDNEELKHDPVSALRKVERFLGLEHVITDKMFVLNKDKGFYCIQSNITDTGMACYSENRGQKKQILSHDVASESEITPCNKICKPLVVYRFTGNVITSITTLRT